MKTDRKTITEIERLLEEYEVEVENKRKSGVLADKTAKTYLHHANTFVRWCKGDFVPGAKNIYSRK